MLPKFSKQAKYFDPLVRFKSRVNSRELNEIQGDFESCADILITSYWLHVELGKNI
jgi:hypothetical protein